jgi:4-hydroxy-2-oxovalerate aldolase
MDNSEELIILDCTIRDGNYAVNYKFTEKDTSLLIDNLVKLGVKWLEIGHGLGLGAMEAGMGNMTATDRDMILAAKSVCKDAKIGMFFIPGIAHKEHLDMAQDCGLDFVRIGVDAPEAEKAFPYVTHARKLGLIPCLNMMKSYAVIPEEFANSARNAVDSGADVIYCVDSSGCMMPEELSHYYEAVRSVVECKMGFHGHNNLMLAIANSFTAYKCGVRYIDATFCGIGRSAGNAPLEILIAVFERLGISTGIDIFEVMNTIETYVWPLVSRIRPNDMMSVTAGYSRFHSSFLPKIALKSREYKTDLRKLVARVAFHDPVNLDEAFLDKAAGEMADTSVNQSSDKLISFQSLELSINKISNTLHSVKVLVEGLVTSSAKRSGTYTVLHLVPSKKQIEGLVIPEYVLSDGQMVLGRVTFGSIDVLKQIVDIAKSDISLYLVNHERAWSKNSIDMIAPIVGAERLMSICDKEIKMLFLRETLEHVGRLYGLKTILFYSPDNIINDIIESCNTFHTKYVFGSCMSESMQYNEVVVLNNFEDWKSINLEFDIIVFASIPTEQHAKVILNSLSKDGRIVLIAQAFGNNIFSAFSDRLVYVDLNLAYSGIVSRYIVLKSFAKSRL